MKLTSKMNSYIPQVGDMILINCWFYQHVGIYVGPHHGGCGDVIHNHKGHGVILSTLSDFSRGVQVVLHKRTAMNWRQQQEIANRAMSLVGQKYNLWNFNCEHAASLAQTGKSESPQLAGLIVMGLLALGLLALARKK